MSSKKPETCPCKLCGKPTRMPQVDPYEVIAGVLNVSRDVAKQIALAKAFNATEQIIQKLIGSS